MAGAIPSRLIRPVRAALRGKPRRHLKSAVRTRDTNKDASQDTASDRRFHCGGLRPLLVCFLPQLPAAGQRIGGRSAAGLRWWGLAGSLAGVVLSSMWLDERNF